MDLIGAKTDPIGAKIDLIGAKIDLIGAKTAPIEAQTGLIETQTGPDRSSKVADRNQNFCAVPCAFSQIIATNGHCFPILPKLGERPFIIWARWVDEIGSTKLMK